MKSRTKSIWDAPQTSQLSLVLSDLTAPKDVQNFLRDVMTEKEIIEIAARLEAARMLNAKQTYATISEKTKLSSRTIARISEWLQNGNKGYKAAIKSIEAHHRHITPERD
jgi:TrpR-related protein YerC/YecD